MAAARTLRPEELTMQAVADVLGVDRKTLNYHVSDRRGLLELVAAEVFADAMSGLSVRDAEDWQDAVRVYADGVRAGVVQLGALAPHFHLQPAAVEATVAPADELIQRLLAEGFGPREVARALRLVSALATASGREAARLAAGVQHTSTDAPLDQVSVLLGAVGSFPGLRRLAAVEASPPDPGQWEFDLSVCIAGIAHLGSGPGEHAG